MQDFVESVLESLDINVFEVYKMTPKELLLKSKQLQAMGREQLKQDISVAYFAERLRGSKKLPKLDKILKGVDKHNGICIQISSERNANRNFAGRYKNHIRWNISSTNKTVCAKDNARAAENGGD
ncbi:MAG: hypothetical protein R3Y65_00450 [Bacillota bacterium]